MKTISIQVQLNLQLLNAFKKQSFIAGYIGLNSLLYHAIHEAGLLHANNIYFIKVDKVGYIKLEFNPFLKGEDVYMELEGFNIFNNYELYINHIVIIEKEKLKNVNRIELIPIHSVNKTLNLQSKFILPSIMDKIMCNNSILKLNIFNQVYYFKIKSEIEEPFIFKEPFGFKINDEYVSLFPEICYQVNEEKSLELKEFISWCLKNKHKISTSLLPSSIVYGEEGVGKTQFIKTIKLEYEKEFKVGKLNLIKLLKPFHLDMPIDQIKNSFNIKLTQLMKLDIVILKGIDLFGINKQWINSEVQQEVSIIFLNGILSLLKNSIFIITESSSFSKLDNNIKELFFLKIELNKPNTKQRLKFFNGNNEAAKQTQDMNYYQLIQYKLNNYNLSIPKTASKYYSIIKVDEHSLDFIGGYKPIISKLKLFIKLHNHPNPLQLKPPKAFLFHGESGAGKSFFAHCLANSFQLPIVKVVCSQLFSSDFAQTEDNVRSLFQLNKQYKKYVLWLEDIDLLCVKRGSNNEDAMTNNLQNRILTSILNELDGVEYNNTYILIACTNNIENMDEAVLRPGRIDQLINIEKSDDEGRVDILYKILKFQFKFPYSELTSDELNTFKIRTKGYYAVNIQHCLRNAILFCIENDIPKLNFEHILKFLNS